LSLFHFTYTQRFAAQFAWFIATKLNEIATTIRGKFTVLIISPTKVQARKVAGALKKKGFQGVEFIERADKTPSLLDGLKVLLENGSSNLGWRIVAGELLKDKKDDLKSLLEKNNRDDAPAIQALVSREDKKLTKKMLTVLRNVRDDSPIACPGKG
jgi:hypothetical protein